jgi:signal transduction histidine kinase
MRNREDHEGWRLGLTVLVVAALVTGFGGLAQRRQRRELELQRQVAVSALQREREALLAKADKMAALAALSTGIAHELGTPLGVIVGRVEQALARSKHDERLENALGIVLEQVSRIQAIVRGCLALARGDSPHLVQMAPVPICRTSPASPRCSSKRS